MSSEYPPEVTIPACDISGIGVTGSKDTRMSVKVMRAMTFIVIGGRQYSVERADWDKIRAIAPPGEETGCAAGETAAALDEAVEGDGDATEETHTLLRRIRGDQI